MGQAIWPVMLVILDGFGWREELADNAVRQARKPNFDRLWQSCPHAFLRTSGEDVGLPRCEMGIPVGRPSEHRGRPGCDWRSLPRISRAAKDGSLRPRTRIVRNCIAKMQGSGRCTGRFRWGR